jgi:hypothetical protein
MTTPNELVSNYYRRLLADPDDYWIRRMAQGRLTWKDFQRRCWEAAVSLVSDAWEDEGVPW